MLADAYGMQFTVHHTIPTTGTRSIQIQYAGASAEVGQPAV